MKTPGLKGQFAVFPKRDPREKPKVIPGAYKIKRNLVALSIQ